jgi:hypothetical protein
VRSAEDKVKVAARNARMVRNFRSEMGFRVNHTKPSSLSAKDGSTSPLVFQEFFSIFSDDRRIVRFVIILQAFFSGVPIDCEPFDPYVKERSFICKAAAGIASLQVFVRY